MSLCKVQFEPAGVTVEADTDKPLEGLAEPGSLLNVAQAGGVKIDHPCDGVGACGMCIVVVEQGMEHLTPISEEEEEFLDATAPGVRGARLACLAVVQGDVTCRVGR
jgi:ferredoxin